MKNEMFTKHKVFFYFVGSWHAAYRLHPRILPDLRNLAELGHAKLYPRFCWTLYWTVAENTIFRRSGFRFASSNADVPPLLRLLNGWDDGGAIIFRRGFIFPLPSRCDIGGGGIMIGASEMGVPLAPSQNQCVRTETALLLTCVFVCRAAVSI